MSVLSLDFLSVLFCRRMRLYIVEIAMMIWVVPPATALIKKEQECFSIYCDDGFIIWRMTVTFKKYLIYRSQCRVMEYMYTTIFFFTFNYRIHYKTKLKTPGEWVINIFLNKIKLSFIDALYRIINGHNSTINSQFYIFIITTNINWIYINDFFYSYLLFYLLFQCNQRQVGVDLDFSDMVLWSFPYLINSMYRIRKVQHLFCTSLY